ncbi:MAG: archaemetzincin family Zn-dependent metalloprotease [Candidatus Edwardsbacteria bacterium]
METNKKIYLVSIGKIDGEILDFLKTYLSQNFNLPCVVGEALPSPDYAYNQERQQYWSTAILARLKQKISKDALRVLGIIDLDLFAPELNFIFGEADITGRVSLISLYRLRNETYGLSPDRDLLFKRAAKEAVHELGHTFGLRHCADVKCVMHFSNCLKDTDIKSAEFCKDCIARMRPDEHRYFRMNLNNVLNF